MRAKPSKFLESNRWRGQPMGSDESCGNNGAFDVAHKGKPLKIIASDGGGWDHVSVSRYGECPTWEEMCYVKNLFFKPDEWVLQYHPAAGVNVNCHPYCLHLWRPQGIELPKPPSWMVGPTEEDDRNRIRIQEIRQASGSEG